MYLWIHFPGNICNVENLKMMYMTIFDISDFEQKELVCCAEAVTNALSLPDNACFVVSLYKNTKSLVFHSDSYIRWVLNGCLSPTCKKMLDWKTKGTIIFVFHTS